MIRLLTSYRFAFVAIALLLLSLVAGVVVFPDQSPVQQTYWFIGLLGILAVSMGICTYRRAARELAAYRERRSAPAGNPRSFSSQILVQSPFPPGVTRDLVRKASTGWNWGSARQSAGGDLSFEKGRPGVWGSIVFHCALMIVITGIGISMTFGIRGMFALTEGEAFDGSSGTLKSLSSGMFSDRSVPGGLQVSLVRFEKKYRVGASATPAGHLKILDDGRDVSTVIHLNNGYEGLSGTLYLGDKWGFSPAIDIMDTAGNVVFAGFLRLATIIEGDDVRFGDRIELEQGRVLEVEFYPSLRVTDTAVTSKGTDLNNPYILLTLSENERVLVKEYLAVNQSCQRGDLVIAFPQVRHWAQFDFVHDPAIPLLYTGFSLAIAGLALRLMFVKKKMNIVISPHPYGATVTISGWSDKYQNALCDELEDCAARITQALEAEPAHPAPAIDIHSLIMTPQECN